MKYRASVIIALATCVIARANGITKADAGSGPTFFTTSQDGLRSVELKAIAGVPNDAVSRDQNLAGIEQSFYKSRLAYQHVIAGIGAGSKTELADMKAFFDAAKDAAQAHPEIPSIVCLYAYAALYYHGPQAAIEILLPNLDDLNRCPTIAIVMYRAFRGEESTENIAISFISQGTPEANMPDPTMFKNLGDTWQEAAKQSDLLSIYWAIKVVPKDAGRLYTKDLDSTIKKGYPDADGAHDAALAWSRVLGYFAEKIKTARIH